MKLKTGQFINLELDLNSMQDHYWSGLDEHWNEINYLECRGRTNQGMGAVNFISAQGNTMCFTKEIIENTA